MNGSTIAQRGYLCEQYVSATINYYINGSVVEFPSELPADEQLKIRSDAHVISDNIMRYTEFFGPVKQAKHVGFQINYGVVDITGKQSPADVLLEIEDFGWLGISLKYGQTKNRPKVYAPPPSTFAERIDKHYQAVYNAKSGLVEKVEILTDEKMDSADALKARNQALMVSVFDEPFPPLNKAQLSMLRKIMRGDIDYFNRQAVEDFYILLRRASMNNNKRMAEVFHETISQIVEGLGTKETQENLFRDIANIPKPNEEGYLPTIMVSVKQTMEEPMIEIYDYVHDVDNYLKTLGDSIPLNKRKGTCCFRYGALAIEVNTRAGSRSAGAVNVTLDKKILTNVGLQEISNRESQAESNRNGRSQGETEGIPPIPGGPGREGEG